MSDPTPTSSTWHRLMGIVGGLGPHAHVALEERLLWRVVDAAEEAVADQQYPPWVLVSVPETPDRTAAVVSDGPSPVPRLLDALGRLDAAGCDFALVACNSVHAFAEELRRESPLPLLDMVEETVRAAARGLDPRGGGAATLGVLATTGTLASGTYHRAAERVAPGVRLVTPLDLGADGERLQEECVMGAIYGGTERVTAGIKGGGHRRPDGRRRIREALETAIGRLAEEGAEAVLLSCTELPLVLDEGELRGVALVDCLDAAAAAALDVASGRRDLPSR